MGQPEFGRVAGVDRPPFGSRAEHLLAGEIGIDDVFGCDPQGLEIHAEERGIGVHPEHARDPHAEARPALHDRSAADVPGGDGRRFPARVRLPDFPAGVFQEVGVRVARRVEIRLDRFHGPRVFHRPFLAGRDDEAARLSPLPADVDERPEAVVLAETAAGFLPHRRPVLDPAHRVQADEGGPAPLAPEGDGLEGGADGPRLPRVLVDDDLGRFPGPPEALLDEIHLRLDRRQVVLRPPLQDEARAQFRQVGDLGDVEPDVLGEYGRQPGEDLVGFPPLPLEAGDVGLEEHGAAVGEDGHFPGREGDLGELFHAVAEPLGDRLQEVAVPGRALGVELEVLDAPVLEHHELDVLPAHVHDGVRDVVIVQRRLGVGHRFHQGHVGADDVAQGVLGVTGGRRPQHLDPGPLRLDLAAELFQDLDRVLDGVPPGELVRPGQDLPLGGQEDRLGGGRPAVDADEAPGDVPGGKHRRHERRGSVGREERGHLLLRAGQRRDPVAVPAATARAVGEQGPHLFRPQVTPDFRLLVPAELDGPQRPVIFGVLRRPDPVLGPRPLRDLDPALPPHQRDVVHPRFPHPGDEGVRPPQKQHVGQERVAAREHLQVLDHEGLEQGGHQFLGRDPLFLQAVDVGFGEHAAFAGHRVQADPVVMEPGQVGQGDAQLHADLVDDRTGAPGALVVHRGELLGGAVLGLLAQDDDLGVLPPDFHEGGGLRAAPFHRQRGGQHLLDELGPDQLREHGSAGPGGEHPPVAGPEARFPLHALQEIEQGLQLARLVPAVVLPQDRVGFRIGHHGLDRCGTHVNSGNQSGHNQRLTPNKKWTDIDGGSPTRSPGGAAPHRPAIRSPTWSTKLAATPAVPLRCGTRYMGRLNSGCWATKARIWSRRFPVLSRAS